MPISVIRSTLHEQAISLGGSDRRNAPITIEYEREDGSYRIKAVIDRQFQLEELEEAFRYQLSGAHFGKMMATMSGAAPEGIAPSMESYVTPTFRGYIANYSTSLYPEINDCFYNDRFLDLAKSHRKAQYAKPQMMLSRSRRAVSASLSHDPAAVRLIARTLGRLVASAWAA